MSVAPRYIFGKYLDPLTGVCLGMFTFLQFEKTNNIPEERRIMYNLRQKLGYSNENKQE